MFRAQGDPGAGVNLTNEDVADILALLDSLPYDELDLQTSRFRLILRRTPGGWTQSTEILPASGEGGNAVNAVAAEVKAMGGQVGNSADDRDSGNAGRTEDAGGGGGRGFVAVRAPLPGTFYRAPRPGAAPFVEVGSRVGAETVIGIVETMKLMNSVPAGVTGVVAEFCVANAEFAAQGAALLRIRADR
jgi:acetyl-CoA carboxylase biotin carboxyl carrier protein